MKAFHFVTISVGSLVILLGITAPSFAYEVETGLTSMDRKNFAISLNEKRANDAFVGPQGGAKLQIVPNGIPLGQFVPFLGPEIEKVSVIENGIKVEKYWQSLSSEQWKNTLSGQFVQTLIYDAKSSGNLSFLPITASLGKGQFRLIYHNFRTKYYPCSEGNRSAGNLLVGVGLRIDIEAKFKRGSFSLGLGQLALSANRKKVAGSVQAIIVGLANSNTLSTVVGAAAGDLTYESLIEASKAYAVANQAVENMVALSNPRIFGYQDLTEPGSCLAALKADVNQ